MSLFSFVPFYQDPALAVVPVLIGPLQALLAILPGLLVGLATAIFALFKPSTFEKLVKLLWAQKIPIIGIVGVVFATVHFWPTLFPPKLEATAAVEVGDRWPMYRGGPERRGFVKDKNFEEAGHGGVQWNFRGGFKTFYASPCIVGNRAYVSSVNYQLMKDNGAIFCLDADTGAMVWKFDADGFRSTFSSPAVAGKYLVSGEGLHLVKDARVFCLDVERSERERKGVKLWDFRTKSHVESSPCIDEKNGRAFIGAGDDGWYCFALEPDENGKAKVLWHLSGDKYPDAETAPLLHGDYLYFGLGLGGHAVCCVRADTGAEVWRTPTPYAAFGSPAFGDGKLFVGMGNGDFVNDAETLLNNAVIKLKNAGKSKEEIAEAVKGMGPAGAVWCLDAATGEVLWRCNVGRTVLAPPVFADGEVWFGSRDKFLYRVSAADGTIIGKWNARVALVTAPAVAENTVYQVTSSDGRLHALDRKSMRPFWDLTLGTTGDFFLSSPAAARGHVYVGTGENGFMCLGQPGRVKERPFWAGRLGGERGGRVDDSPLPERGKFAWRFPKAAEDGAAESAPPLAVTSPPAFGEDVLYLGTAAEKSRGLAKVKLGPRPKREPEQAWLSPTDHPVVLSAAVAGDMIFFTDGRPGDAQRRLRCSADDDGREVWNRPVAADASGEFRLFKTKIKGARLLLTADRADGLTCLEVVENPHVPQQKWTVAIGPVSGVPAIFGDMFFVVAGRPAALLALDAPTGRVLWSASLSGTPLGSPACAGEAVWVNGSTGLEAFALISGRRVALLPASRTASAPISPPPDSQAFRRDIVGNDEYVTCVTAVGELLVVKPRLGRYRVDAWVTEDFLKNAVEAAYVVKHAEGAKEVVIDLQKQPSPGWISLGIFTFAADEEAEVGVKSDSKPACASALRFVPIGPKTDDAESKELADDAITIRADDIYHVSYGKGDKEQLHWVRLPTSDREPAAYFCAGQEPGAALFTWKTHLPPTGVEYARIAGAAAAVAPLLSGDRVLYHDGESFQIFDLTAKRSSRWMATKLWGEISMPPAVFDSILFFVTGKRGLLSANERR